jgi:hypothetical protein
MGLAASTNNPTARLQGDLDSRLRPDAAALLRSIQASGFPGWSSLPIDQAAPY